MASEQSQPEKDQDPRRRQWQAPKLVEYGHIGKLTQGSSGGLSDGSSRKV